ncbi:MAG: hypothetical protein P4L61_01580 [Candidatus Pacebacteria bacterium]|nr:hypothetical protein [Candidatus Paceibacterota bacterium]
MKTKPSKSIILAPLFATLFGLVIAFSAHAAITPTISLSSINNGQVQMNVTGDPNAPIYLYYYNQYPSSAPQSAGVIGYTLTNQYFSTTISNGQYNIQPGSYVYVMIDGAMSQTAAWPVYSGSGSYNYGSAITFSQNNVSLAQNQTVNVTLYGGTGTYYISQNSSLVTAYISGNSLALTGVTAGSASLSICSNSGSCGSLYVTVTSSSGGYGYNYSTTYPSTTYPYSSYPTYSTYPAISLSQGTVALNANQQQSIGIYGSGQGYFVYSNSNPNVVTANVSGNSLLVSGIQPGASSMMICESVGSSCTTLYVTVITQPVVSYNYNPTTYYSPAPTYYTPPQPIQPVTYTYLLPVTRFFSNFNPGNWGRYF